MKVLTCCVYVLVTGVLGSIYDYSNQAGWGGTCTAGKKQSPINVIKPKSSTEVNSKLISLPDGAKAVKLTNKDNQNTLKFSFPSGMTYSIPGMKATGTLLQLHLHWGANDKTGSEHSLDSVYFAAEAHLVTSYKDGADTKYAVVNRFFKVGAENAQIKQLIEAQKSSGELRNIAKFDATAIYPSKISEVLTYSGSLTTPTCDEIVHWVIVPDALTISTEQLSALRTLKMGSGSDPAKSLNWRSEQELNGRTITSYKHTASSGFRALVSPLIIVSVLFKMVL